MSLVNQMLQDLEHRRTAEASASPLGGLSASGVAVPTAQSVNYVLLGSILMLLFAVIFALIYLLEQKQPLDMASASNMEVVSTLPRAELTATVPLPISNEIPKPVVSAQASTDEEKPLSLNLLPAKTQLVKNKPQSMVQDNKTNFRTTEPKITESKTTKVKSVELSLESIATENAGTVTITESAQRNKKSTSQTVAFDGQENREVSASVNKTIHPLTPEQQAQMAFQSAVKMLGRGDESGAEQALEKALLIVPAHERARETLSALLLNTGRISEAAQRLSEGLRLRPTSTPLAKLYARILVDQGDNDAAVAVLERARPPVADAPDYYALLAVLYRGVGQHAQAAQVYQQILRIQPGVATWWMGLALSEEAIGAPPQALEAYQRALRAGGLKAEVLHYVRSRIAALTPIVSQKSSDTVAAEFATNSNGFED